jgi:hypothetical protein
MPGLRPLESRLLLSRLAPSCEAEIRRFIFLALWNLVLFIEFRVRSRSLRCERVGWTAGCLPSMLYFRTYFTVHRSWDRVFVLYVHMAKDHPFTPEPPRPTRPVTRVLQREHVASEQLPPLTAFLPPPSPVEPEP